MEKMTPQSSERLQILIAEDEENIRDLLVELLSQEDRDITVIHDGLEAVRHLRKRSYDLLITDLMMPELDGIDVLHQAKKLHPQILVIIITGYASLETAIQAVKEGAYDYLRKPFRLEELKISVDNACERIQLIRENRLLIEHLRKTPSDDKEKKTEEIKDLAFAVDPSYLGLDWLPPSYFEAGTPSAGTTLSVLERLGNLLQQGLLDKEEFHTLKKKLLGRL